MITARTQLSYNHPDEWFQTIEFANQWATGLQSFTQEVYLHLRNQSWPWLLSVPLRLIKNLWPQSLLAPLIGIKLFTAFLDILHILFFYKICVETLIQKSAKHWVSPKIFGWCLVLFSPLLQEASRPSQEHLSAIAFWFGIFGLYRFETSKSSSGKFISITSSGLFLALTGVMRPASGLLGLGAAAVYCIYLCSQWALKRPKALTYFTAFLLGSGSGLLIGGIADWIAYGRPYESLIQYLHYNVFTGLGAKNFGTQSAIVYLDWLFSLFPYRTILIFMPSILLACLVAIQRARKGNLKFWFKPKISALWSAILSGILLFLLGHCLIGHKEPRFLAPLLLPVTLGILIVGSFVVNQLKSPKTKQIVTAAIALVFMASTIQILVGDFLKLSDNYFELPNHLESAQNKSLICAVLTQKRLKSTLIPEEFLKKSKRSMGLISLNKSRTFEPGESRVAWIEYEPDCMAVDSRVLIQLRYESPFLKQNGCEILESGLLRYFSKDSLNIKGLHDWIKAYPLVSGAWQNCPANILAFFKSEGPRKILATGFFRHLNTTPLPFQKGFSEIKSNYLETYLDRAKQGIDWQKLDLADGTFSDLP